METLKDDVLNEFFIKYDELQSTFENYHSNMWLIINEHGKEKYDDIMDEIHDKMLKLFEEIKK